MIWVYFGGGINSKTTRSNRSLWRTTRQRSLSARPTASWPSSEEAGAQLRLWLTGGMQNVGENCVSKSGLMARTTWVWKSLEEYW
jgi:hypothetical protein